MSAKSVLKVNADTENLCEVQDFVNAILEANDCPLKTQMLIEVSLEELFVNIARYLIRTVAIGLRYMPPRRTASQRSL